MLDTIYHFSFDFVYFNQSLLYILGCLFSCMFHSFFLLQCDIMSSFNSFLSFLTLVFPSHFHIFLSPYYLSAISLLRTFALKSILTSSFSSNIYSLKTNIPKLTIRKSYTNWKSMSFLGLIVELRLQSKHPPKSR